MNVTAPALNLAPLLDVEGCCKSFRKPDGDELVAKEAAVDRGDRALVRAERPRVLGGA